MRVLVLHGVSFYEKRIDRFDQNWEDAMDDNRAPRGLLQQDRWLSAATAAFAGGYHAASTRAIAQAAGMSKALLFHDFSSKEGLLMATAEAAMAIAHREFFTQVNFSEGDFFRRLWRIFSLRLEITAVYPALFDFLGAVATHPDPAFAAPRAALTKAYPDAFPLDEGLWYDAVDPAYFKPGLDVTKAVTCVRWAFAGRAALLPPSALLSDPEEMNRQAKQELWDYISFFRKQFYAKS
jgi:AcrR family transcriptional regulator